MFSYLVRPCALCFPIVVFLQTNLLSAMLRGGPCFLVRGTTSKQTQRLIASTQAVLKSSPLPFLPHLLFFSSPPFLSFFLFSLSIYLFPSSLRSFFLSFLLPSSLFCSRSSGVHFFQRRKRFQSGNGPRPCHWPSPPHIISHADASPSR